MSSKSETAPKCKSGIHWENNQTFVDFEFFAPIIKAD